MEAEASEEDLAASDLTITTAEVGITALITTEEAVVSEALWEL